ncbi:hypothetical protein B0A66_19810 [Flavobacterium hercynium]|uniref:Uncharacterized protein n=1 Tax=Flavobacterium hercynium TaxID=387094 RepID=A0A226GUH8_9FLAO|nr:hypothetical protein B0A66_19810 [Flavobacterium hercynium]
MQNYTFFIQTPLVSVSFVVFSSARFAIYLRSLQLFLWNTQKECRLDGLKKNRQGNTLTEIKLSIYFLITIQIIKSKKYC